MNSAYQIKPTIEKGKKIDELLNGYWGSDIWEVSDPIFDEFRIGKLSPSSRKTINFSNFSNSIGNEIKYFFSVRLATKEITVLTLINYARALKEFAEFLNKNYPNIKSIIDIKFDEAYIQWRSTVIGKRPSNDKKYYKNAYTILFNQLYSFLINHYDTREEYEKDIWDCRNISGAKITNGSTNYNLNFLDIPEVFRALVKRYIRFRSTVNSQSHCNLDIMALRLFTNYIHDKEPSWESLALLTREHMEGYLSWYKDYAAKWKDINIKYITLLRAFFQYIQRAGYPEAPENPYVSLIFKEDIPRVSQKSKEDIKYIPEGVLQQLEENLEHVKPSEFIPIIILLRASGWRISDLLNLRYDTCLDRTTQGWYLCGDIPKVQVLNHRVPITDEVYAVVQSVVDEVKNKSTDDNNPEHLLFVRFNGKRKGKCIQRQSVQQALNRLTAARNITDDQGNIFHFSNHAFRHTKGVELINNGMNILHVQKWMAHSSPEMTLRYAQILDTTMRKSWEEATRQGLFKIGESGEVKRIDISELHDEDVIEWEYIRHNLDAVRMPLGYCMKPKKQECHTQLNPCLTCRNLCTTSDFISQYEVEIQETKALIERGKAQGQSVWVEKNMILLQRLEEIHSVLNTGKIHHKAGKRGREYVGEERNNVKQS